MTNNNLTHPAYPLGPVKPVLIGGAFALIVIGVFLAGVHHPHADWGKFWMVRPLIITPLAGATGGACYYFINQYFYQNNWSKIAAVVLSLLVYIIGLWLGIVLGLAGTLWH